MINSFFLNIFKSEIFYKISEFDSVTLITIGKDFEYSYDKKLTFWTKGLRIWRIFLETICELPKTEDEWIKLSSEYFWKNNNFIKKLIKVFEYFIIN